MENMTPDQIKAERAKLKDGLIAAFQALQTQLDTAASELQGGCIAKIRAKIRASLEILTTEP